MATTTVNPSFAKYSVNGAAWQNSSSDLLRGGIDVGSNDFKIALEFDMSAFSGYDINSVAVQCYQINNGSLQNVQWTVENATAINASDVSGVSGTKFALMGKNNAYDGWNVGDVESMATYGIVHIRGSAIGTYAEIRDKDYSGGAFTPYIIVDYSEPTTEINDAYVVAATISGTDITFGAPLEHENNIWGQYISVLDTDEFALIYPKNDITVENTKTFSISGTTITEEDEEQWLALNSQNASMLYMSTTKYIITYDVWNSTTTTYDSYVVCCEVDSSLIITVGAALKLGSASFVVGSTLLGADRVGTIYNDGNYKLATLDISGTTISLDDTISLGENISSLKLDTLDDEEIIIAFKDELNKGIGTVEIVTTNNNVSSADYYARYAEITVTGTGTSKLYIRGNKINDSVTSVIIDNSVDGKEYKNNNELIDDSTHASSVGDWVNDVLKNRKRVKLAFRCDPRLDIADTIKHITTYITENVFASDFKLTFNGAFIADVEGVVIE